MTVVEFMDLRKRSERDVVDLINSAYKGFNISYFLTRSKLLRDIL
jgi:hypothetical protein